MIVVIAENEELDLVRELGLENNPIIITGVGAINVINALRNVPKNEMIVNIGYCGSNNIEVGTKVQVSTVHTFHEGLDFYEDTRFCEFFWDNFRKWDVIAPCYTSTSFVTHTDIKEDCVFDMELAYICAMFDNVYAIKKVSDKLSYKEYKENL